MVKMVKFAELLDEQIEKRAMDGLDFDIEARKDCITFENIRGYKIKYCNASRVINQLREHNLRIKWNLETNIGEIIQDQIFLSLIANGDEILFYMEFTHELYESIMNFVVKVQFKEILFSIKNVFRPIGNLFQMLRNIKQVSRAEVFAWFSADSDDLLFEEDLDDI